MVIHKRTRLTPIQRKEIYEAYHQKKQKVSELATSYHVSRPTIYKILERGRKQDFTIHSSIASSIFLTSPIDSGKSHCLKGAPLRNAPGFFSSTAR